MNVYVELWLSHNFLFIIMPESNHPPSEASRNDAALNLVIGAKEEAAALVADAVHTAEDVVQKATRTAEKLLDDREDRITKALADALRQVFGENQDARRFIDITRIPLICQSINGIYESLKDLQQMLQDSQTNFVNQDQFAPVKNVVFGLVGILMTGVVVALLSLLINKTP